jgi:hypothetical protein
MTRVPTLAMVVLGGFGFVGPASAQAPISQYPYCMQGDDNPGWSGCSFNTLQACQAAASGTFAECLTNPWYQPGTDATPASDGNQMGANSLLPVGPPPPD